MDELKIGDIVEVNIEHLYEPEWIDAIFIKYGNKGGSIICVAGSYEDNYLDGLSFSTNRWEHNAWRIKKEIEYIPFTLEDKKSLMRFWVVNKQTNYTYFITAIMKYGIELSGEYVGFNELLELYTFYNGTPCGKLKGGLK